MLLLISAGALENADAGPIELISDQNPLAGWSFGNGPEFPGADGELAAGPDGALVLGGDFSGGGLYVQMGRRLDDVHPGVLSLGLRSPDDDVFTMRLGDATGQTHQIKLRVRRSERFEPLTFPVADFFEHMGTPRAVPGVARYQFWGGANDGAWHGPAKSIHILTRKHDGSTSSTVAIRGLTLTDAPPPAPEAPTAGTTKWVPLLELIEGQTEWNFYRGQEFKGSRGGFEVVVPGGSAAGDLPHGHLLRLSGDFTGIGYVGTARNLSWMRVRSLRGIQLKLRSDNAKAFNLRVVDGTGQTFQRKNNPLPPDGRWHEVTMDLARITSSEAWGGAGDRKWHGSPRSISLLLNHTSAPDGKPVLDVADVRLLVEVGSRVEEPSYTHGFEGGGAAEGWSFEGDAAVTLETASAGDASLRLSRDIRAVERATSAVGPSFPAGPGEWDVGVAMRSDLVSPDNSFRGLVRLQWLDGAGRPVDTVTVAERFGAHDWTTLSKRVDAPATAVAGRFRVEMLKARGAFEVDQLTAAAVAAGSHEGKRIDRALVRHERTGNLLYPGDEPVFSVAIESVRPLPAEHREATYTLHDYWGNEQGPARTATLVADGRNRASRFVYRGELDLGGLPIEEGRYYEVRLTVPEAGSEPFTDFRSFAVLPEAPANAYPWREVPFTSRNWDNRVQEYVTLTHRLGVRTVNLRSDWSPEPPYQAGAALYDKARGLDMAVMLMTPIWKLEHHRDNFQAYTPEALRQGAINMARKYAADGHAVFVLGNEPRKTQERVDEVKDAYRIVYEAIKSVDPDIPVVGTSIGAVELYLKEGIGAHQDAYNMHTYEDPVNIRRSMARYRELFKKYGHAKPIWSTEIGLNSQGLTRRAVANSLIRKASIFFAEGGQSFSWFTIFYPDRNAKLFGGSEDSHNTFDGRYRIASPRMDAIAYYNVVNGILDKGFVEERRYSGDAEAYLFRNAEGESLMVLWSDTQENDVFVPLPGVGAVTLTTIDGGRHALDARRAGVTLRVGPDAVLLSYRGGPAALPEALGEPALAITQAPARMTTGGGARVAVRSPGPVEIVAPPAWRVEPVLASDGDHVFTVTAPKQTQATALPLIVRGADGSGLIQTLVPVTGEVSASLVPLPPDTSGAPGVRLTIRNQSDRAKRVRWSLGLEGNVMMRGGQINLNALESTLAALTLPGGVPTTQTVPAGGSLSIDARLSGLNPLAAYRVVASVSDGGEVDLTERRWMGGFVGVLRTDDPVVVDGKLDEAAWADAPSTRVDDEEQFRMLKKVEGASWEGPDDLSADMRLLWDDEHLYLGVTVTDEARRDALEGMPIWRQDGLQMLFAPGRGAGVAAGKTEVAAGVTDERGAHAHVYLTANPALVTGPADDIAVAVGPAAPAVSGDHARVYEIAIPWDRLAPFEPRVGGNLGMTLAVNEDDGEMRYSYLSWFGDVQTKQVDGVGDLILVSPDGSVPAE